jgi:hypothetical protein
MVPRRTDSPSFTSVSCRPAMLIQPPNLAHHGSDRLMTDAEVRGERP